VDRAIKLQAQLNLICQIGQDQTKRKVSRKRALRLVIEDLLVPAEAVIKILKARNLTSDPHKIKKKK